MKQKSQIFLRFDYFLENKKPNQSGLEMAKFIYIFGLKYNFLAQGDLCTNVVRPKERKFMAATLVGIISEHLEFCTTKL